jgi:hypothetical protein
MYAAPYHLGKFTLPVLHTHSPISLFDFKSFASISSADSMYALNTSCPLSVPASDNAAMVYKSSHARNKFTAVGREAIISRANFLDSSACDECIPTHQQMKLLHDRG